MTDQIYLSRLDKSELEFVRQLRNKNRQYFVDINEVSKEDHLEWYKEIHRKADFDFYVIYLKGTLDDTPIGTISTHLLMNGVVELGNICIAQEYRRNGYLREVIKILEHDIYLVPIVFELEVKIENINAVLVYEELGFKSICFRMRKEI